MLLDSVTPQQWSKVSAQAQLNKSIFNATPNTSPSLSFIICTLLYNTSAKCVFLSFCAFYCSRFVIVPCGRSCPVAPGGASCALMGIINHWSSLATLTKFTVSVKILQIISAIHTIPQFNSIQSIYISRYISRYIYILYFHLRFISKSILYTYMKIICFYLNGAERSLLICINEDCSKSPLPQRKDKLR